MTTTPFPRVFISTSADNNNHAAATVGALILTEYDPSAARFLTRMHVQMSAAAAELTATLEAIEAITKDESKAKGLRVYLGQENTVNTLRRAQETDPSARHWVNGKGKPLANAALLSRCFDAGERFEVTWETLGNCGEVGLVDELKARAKKAKAGAIKQARAIPPTKAALAKVERKTGFTPVVGIER